MLCTLSYVWLRFDIRTHAYLHIEDSIDFPTTFYLDFHSFGGKYWEQTKAADARAVTY